MSKLLERLDELEKAATPGPWKFERSAKTYEYEASYEVKALNGHTICHDERYYNNAPEINDAEFIAILRNAYPKLRAVVEAAREVVRDPYPDEIEHLAGTLKALDGVGSDKNDESSLNQSKD